MKRFKNSLIGTIGVYLLLPAVACSQDSPALDRIIQIVEGRIERYENNESPGPVVPREELASLTWHELVQITHRFAATPTSPGKMEAFAYALLACRREDSLGARQATVRLVLEHLFNPSGENSEKFGTRLLNQFGAEDFDSVSKSRLLEVVFERENASGDLIRLLGVANMTDQMPRLRELATPLLNQDEVSQEILRRKSTAWGALLALARLGDESAVERALQWIDANVAPHLAPDYLRDLAYIRHEDAVDILVATMHQQDPRFVTKYPYADTSRLAAVLLFECLEDFPPPKPTSSTFIRNGESTGYSSEAIEICKAWALQKSKWNIRR